MSLSFYIRGQSWRRGSKCDCKTDWLWVRSPLEDMKYLFKFIFPFLLTGLEAKSGVEIRHYTRNATRIWRKLGIRVCGIQREADLIWLDFYFFYYVNIVYSDFVVTRCFVWCGIQRNVMSEIKIINFPEWDTNLQPTVAFTVRRNTKPMTICIDKYNKPWNGLNGR